MMINKIYYAGIGSRETPPDILLFFEQLGAYLANKGFILRSGHALGADQAFEIGCDHAKGKKEIFLPWKGFEGSDSTLYGYNHDAQEIASKHHPYWHNLKPTVRQLHSRNVHQVLGKDLKTPSLFVICWTKKGKDVGGTSQALRIAKAYDIPIFNAGSYDNISEVKQAAKLFIESFINKD